MLDFFKKDKDSASSPEEEKKEKKVSEKPSPKKGGKSGGLKMNLIRDEVVNVFDWRKNLIILALALVLAVALVIAAYWGLIWWGERQYNIAESEFVQEKDISALNQDIKSSQEKINQEILPFQKKLEKTESLLNHHIYWNKFFKFLEDHTLSSVYFSGFSGGLEGQYSLSAQARDIEAIEAQVDKLLQSEFVRDVWVEKASLGATEEGSSVSFTLNISLKTPQVFINY